ncbi:MAG: hypothetical protein LBU51_00685 [Bacteroidales bacterium]|jgi:transcriptional regulator with XRE-family HTH domain|nr:hypothetical protein [Bacteroidales bacterium]
MIDIQVEEILEILQKSTLTNYYIAQKTGFSQSSIGNWREGRVKISPINAKVLQYFFEDEMKKNTLNTSVEAKIKGSHFGNRSNVGNTGVIQQGISISGNNNSFNPNDVNHLHQLIEQKDQYIIKLRKQIEEKDANLIVKLEEKDKNCRDILAQKDELIKSMFDREREIVHNSYNRNQENLERMDKMHAELFEQNKIIAEMSLAISKLLSENK